MALSYRVDPDRRRVEVTAEGRITFDELREYFGAYAADPTLSTSYDALIDLRLVTEFLTPPELRRFASEVPGWLGRMPSRRAIVAPSDVVYGMMRMLEAHTIDAPTEYRVFRDMPSAERWLAEPPDGSVTR